MERTQEEKLLGGLAHIAVLFGIYGLLFNVIIYFIYKPKSDYVLGHVKQGAGLGLFGIIIQYVLGPLLGASMYGALLAGGLGGMFGAGMLGALVMLVLGIAILVLVIMAAIKGFQGQPYRYPFIGDFLAKINV